MKGTYKVPGGVAVVELRTGADGKLHEFVTIFPERANTVTTAPDEKLDLDEFEKQMRGRVDGPRNP